MVHLAGSPPLGVPVFVSAPREPMFRSEGAGRELVQTAEDSRRLVDAVAQ